MKYVYIQWKTFFFFEWILCSNFLLMVWESFWDYYCCSFIGYNVKCLYRNKLKGYLAFMLLFIIEEKKKIDPWKIVKNLCAFCDGNKKPLSPWTQKNVSKIGQSHSRIRQLMLICLHILLTFYCLRKCVCNSPTFWCIKKVIDWDDS